MNDVVTSWKWPPRPATPAGRIRAVADFLDALDDINDSDRRNVQKDLRRDADLIERIVWLHRNNGWGACISCRPFTRYPCKTIQFIQGNS